MGVAEQSRRMASGAAGRMHTVACTLQGEWRMLCHAALCNSNLFILVTLLASRRPG